MLQNIGLILAGLAILIVGAQLLVKGASRLALALGITPLIVGLTIVSTVLCMDHSRFPTTEINQTGQASLTEKETGEGESKLGLVRSTAFWFVLCLILAIVVILATKFLY